MSRNKQIMRIEELKLPSEFSEKEIFNLMHDIYSEIRVKDMIDINPKYYLQANMTKPITSPWESLMFRKNVLLIGAGSGIAPFLPLLEEIIRFDRGKQSKYDFRNATLVFIAREGEQVSWISNYLFHMLSSDFINTFLNIRIYITLKKNAETISSFLFWRSLLLNYKRNINLQIEHEHVFDQEINNHKEDDKIDDRIDPKDLQNNPSRAEHSQLNSIVGNTSPVVIKFGRPNFHKIFRYTAYKGEKDYYVYACVPGVLADHLHYIWHGMKKETGVNFKLVLESFT